MWCDSMRSRCTSVVLDRTHSFAFVRMFRYLDRKPRPACEKPLQPSALHQSICHGLGLADILIEALKVGQSLLKMSSKKPTRTAYSGGATPPTADSAKFKQGLFASSSAGKRRDSLRSPEARATAASSETDISRPPRNAGSPRSPRSMLKRMDSAPPSTWKETGASNNIIDRAAKRATAFHLRKMSDSSSTRRRSSNFLGGLFGQSSPKGTDENGPGGNGPGGHDSPRGQTTTAADQADALEEEELAEQLSNAARITNLLDAVIHCLLALVDKHPMTKRAVLSQVHEVIECVRIGHATSPRKLVTLCKLIFSGEPELCQNVDRELLRLLCSYVHTAMERLDKDAHRNNADPENLDVDDTAPWFEQVSWEATVDFLHETLELILVLIGGEEERPHRTVQSLIEQALLPESEEDLTEKFRKMACSNHNRTTKYADPMEPTRLVLIQLFEAIARGRDAPRVRIVLPLSYFQAEFVAQHAGGATESSQNTRHTLQQLLYSAFFVHEDTRSHWTAAGGTATAVSELVLFAERLRPILHRDKPPETATEMQRLQSTLLVLNGFCEAEKVRDASASTDAIQQCKRIGQVAIEAYVSLQRWTQNGSSSDGRTLRSATGLAGKIARSLTPYELEHALHAGDATAVPLEDDRKHHARKDQGNAKPPAKPQTAAAQLAAAAKATAAAPGGLVALTAATTVSMAAASAATILPSTGSDGISSISSLNIDYILESLPNDPFMKLRAQQEDDLLVRFIRGSFGVAYGSNADEEGTGTSKLNDTSSKWKHKRRQRDLPIHASEMNVPDHPGFHKLLKRFVTYCRRRMKERSPTITRTKTDIVKLIAKHIELVSRADPDKEVAGDIDPVQVRLSRAILPPLM